MLDTTFIPDMWQPQLREFRDSSSYLNGMTNTVFDVIIPHVWFQRHFACQRKRCMGPLDCCVVNPRLSENGA